MKTAILAAATGVFLQVVTLLAATNDLPNTITVDGETYQDVRWGNVTPSAVTIYHKSGVAAIPLEKLPAELQQHFGYEPQKAKEHRVQELAAQKQMRKADAEAAKLAAARRPKEVEAQERPRATEAQKNTQEAENCTEIGSWHWTKEDPPSGTWRSYDVWKYKVTVTNKCDKDIGVCVNFRALALGKYLVTQANVCGVVPAHSTVILKGLKQPNSEEGRIVRWELVN
jgi:hypothetical protein